MHKECVVRGGAEWTQRTGPEFEERGGEWAASGEDGEWSAAGKMRQ